MLKKIIILLLSIILVIAILGANLYITLVSSVTIDSIQATVSNIDISQIINENEETYNQICNELEEKLGIEKEMVDTILNSEVSKNVVGKVAGSYMQYMLTGDESVKLKSDDVIDIIDENLYEAIKLTEHEIPEEKIEEVKEKVIEQIKQNSEVIDNTLDSVYEIDVNEIKDIQDADLDEIRNNIDMDRIENFVDLNGIDKDKINEVGGELQNVLEGHRNSINFEW